MWSTNYFLLICSRFLHKALRAMEALNLICGSVDRIAPSNLFRTSSTLVEHPKLSLADPGCDSNCLASSI